MAENRTIEGTHIPVGFPSKSGRPPSERLVELEARLNAPKEFESGPSKRRMLLRLAVAFGAYFLLSLLWWLGADMESFTPPLQNSLENKLYFAFYNALGLMHPKLFWGWSAFYACGLVILFLGLSVLCRHSWVARLVAYLTIGVWFFVGFAMNSIFIT